MVYSKQGTDVTIKNTIVGGIMVKTDNTCTDMFGLSPTYTDGLRIP